MREEEEVSLFLLYRRSHGLSLIVISKCWWHQDLISVSWPQIISGRDLDLSMFLPGHLGLERKGSFEMLQKVVCDSPALYSPQPTNFLLSWLHLQAAPPSGGKMATRRFWVSNLKRKRDCSPAMFGKNSKIGFIELTCFLCPLLKQPSLFQKEWDLLAMGYGLLLYWR